MSKRQTVNDSSRIGPVSKETAKHIDAALDRVADTAPPTLAKPADSIPWFRRCPVCWEGNGGYGTCYSTKYPTRYYQCDNTIQKEKGPCGYYFTREVEEQIVEVTKRVVKFEGLR
jgi:hypothetical protein